MKIKKMPMNQFKEVLKREWIPVRLMGDAIPKWLHGIPDEVLYRVYASGSVARTFSHNYPQIPSGYLIGGIDVYRNSPDDDVAINIDWYAVILIPSSNDMLMVVGPIKDEGHRIDAIPQRLNDVEILAVPPL